VATIPLIAIAALEAAAGLVQKAGGTDVNGTYWNRNHFAGLLEMVLPITISCAIALPMGSHWDRGTSIIGRLGAAAVMLFSAGLMLVALISSGSKMGFIACLGGLFVMAAVACVASIRGWKRWLIVGILAAFFVSMFVALPPDELVNSFGSAAADRTGEGRLPIWSDSRRLLMTYPVAGSGLGTFDTAFLKYQTAVLDNEFDFAHNDYLQLATELGALGFLILAGFLTAALFKSVRSGTRRFGRSTRYLAWGCTGSLAAIGLHSFTDFNTYIPANALVLAWIFGIVAGFPRRSPPAILKPSRSVRWRPLAIGLACLLLLFAPAWILLEAKFTGNPSVEARFCRFGVCDTAAVMASQTDKHGGNVASVPRGALLAALRRDPDAAFRWCDLGEALLKSGQLEQAKECFSAALAHAPNIPPLQLRAASFYYAIHERERALEQTSRILENSAFYDGPIFDRYGQEQIPLAGIMRTGLPNNRRAWQSYLRYLLNLGKSADAAAVWNGIVALGYGDNRLARDYLASLLQDRRYEAAAQAWASYLGDRGHGYLHSNYLYNGDFEAEPSGVQFDWTMEDLNDDVKVTIASSLAHTGARSLRIQFGGKANVNYGRTSQSAFVKPGRYRFSAFIRSDGITTDQGVGFRIFDSESSTHLDVRTEQVTGTTDWKNIEKIVSVSPGTRLLTI
jgi:tetratricopeptide (TPR) repeat protein